MKSSKLPVFLLLLLLITGCGGGGGGGGNDSALPQKTLISIAVTPNNTSIVMGATQQFTATGTYSDNTMQDLTTLVSWRSLNESIATISNTGLSTAAAIGTSIITATSGDISGSATLTVIAGNSGESNVLAITVNGALCSRNSYPNKACVSVTVCTPGTSNCQTITDIVLDTGSFGLRIFKQALNISLQQATGDSGLLAECVQFADGSSLWGPVQTASVILGNEPSVQVPVHVIDSAFGALPFNCRNANLSPEDAGFNGILGIGFFAEDCGPLCEIVANNGIYYSCNGTQCSGTVIALSRQVQNPVFHLPQDNNGLIVQLPGVPPEGSSSLNGNLVLGIGTRSNNMPSAVTAYPANQFGEFTTDFNGISYSSFIDSGSNGLFFVPPSTGLLPNCPFPNSVWFCPASTTTLSATNVGAFGSPSGEVSFRIGNANRLFSSSNMVFDDIGGTLLGNGFDWGLPFFFGRNVFIGFEGKVAGLGTGPYWAY